jgi:hypothetical protein
MIEYSPYLPKTEREIVFKAIQNNAFFCHPGNLLLAMLCDTDKKKFVKQLSPKFWRREHKKAIRQLFASLKFLLSITMQENFRI